MSLTEDERAAVKDVARDAHNAPTVCKAANEYLEYILNGAPGIEDMEEAVQRAASNLGGNEYQQKLLDAAGLSVEDGYKKGYCTICGNRDDDIVYCNEDSEAHRLVCEYCYEDHGEPDECDRCHATTYEGDEMVSGPREGNFYCNNCLNKLVPIPPGGRDDTGEPV